MYKNIIKFSFAFVGLTFLFLLVAVYRDIRFNKLFNYSKKPAISSFNRINADSEFVKEYSFDFVPTDNYLGAVIVPIIAIQDLKGDVFFGIKENSSANWYHTNTFDFNYFTNLDNYTFGFPVISDSKGKTYRISLIFRSEGNKVFSEVIAKSNGPLLTARYVFPKKILFTNPSKVVEIVKYRAMYSVRTLNVKLIFVIILLVSLITTFASSFSILNLDLEGDKTVYLVTSKILNSGYTSLFFGVSLLFLIAIPVLITLNKFTLAERSANEVWIFCVYGVVWFVITRFIKTYLLKVLKFATSIQSEFLVVFKSKNLLTTFAIILVLIVAVSGLNSKYSLGGDDTRLFYLFPKEFLENFAAKVVSDTSISSLQSVAPPATVPFSLLMFLLKKIVGPLNLQSMLYTTNIILGFAFFYMLLKWLIPIKSKFSVFINSVSSVLYVYSMFTIYTLYNSHLVAVYLVSLFPLFVFLILKAVKERKPVLLICAAVISSVFSFWVLAAPWFIASCITILPLFIYLLHDLKLRSLKYLIGFVFLVLILNFQWLVFTPNSAFFSKSTGISNQSVTSESYREENSTGIRSVADKNSVFYPLMNSYHAQIQNDFQWAYNPIFKGWIEKLLPLNAFFIVIFLIAGVKVKKTSIDSKLFATLFFCYITSVYFFTVNITSVGTSFFVWLNNHIPGFVMFRNMYDKFAYSVAFAFSLFLAISLNVLFRSLKNLKIRKYIVYMALGLVVVNLKPVLFGEYDSAPLWTTQKTSVSLTAFNEDFNELSNYIKNTKDPGRYMIFPLSTGNTFPVPDEYEPNHYYSGTSPILILTGKNDFSGLLSFADYGPKVYTYIKEKNFDGLGLLLQKLNVKYIISVHNISSDLQRSFVYSDGLFFLQNEEMLTDLVGKKINNFGQSYTLYEINSRYISNKIFLTSSQNTFPISEDLAFNKISTELYKVDISSMPLGNKLIFLDPYKSGWELIDENGHSLKSVNHFEAYGYANGWDLSTVDFRNKTFWLYFRPYDYFWPAAIISLLGYLLCVIAIVGNFVVKKKHHD